jgi:uncharacterized protein
MSVAVLGESRDPQNDVRLTRNLRIPSSVPGMTLGADLYRPDTDDGGPFPTLVTLHAAGKDAVGGIGTRRYLRYFAERGYATLYVDACGVGTSEGTSRPMLDPAEVDDGVAVVEWAARQPWSAGRVGMWGYSHGGMTTLATAARRPPSLAAIFPIMGLTDPERDLVHPAGLRGGIGMFGQLGVFDVLTTLLPPLWEDDGKEYGELWRDRLERFTPWLADAWRHRPGDSAWRARAVDPARINVPALCAIGWHDAFCAAMFRAYEQINAPKRLIVGPWLHSFPDSAAVEPVNSMALACQWWDQWLRPGSRPSAPDPGRAVVYLRGDRSRWVQAAAWPPATAGELSLRADGDGRLVAAEAGQAAGPGPASGDRDSAAAVLVTASDPTVGALNGLARTPVNSLGYPPDQHDDDSRSASFTSHALTAPALVAGRPAVALRLRRPSGGCVVRVTDVHPDGRSTIISTGTLNFAARPADGETAGDGTWTVEMTPACYAVAAGHRLRLSVAAADFPALWPAAHPEGLVLVAGSSPRTTRLRLPLAAPGQLADARFLAPPRAVRAGARRPLPPHR